MTLVVACYNHERFLERALETAFGQDHPNLRVIITDDASTDESQRKIVELLEANDWEAELIFHDQNRGICATFNQALARVETPYVAFISADDWQDPHRVSTHVSVLECNPEASMVYGPVNFVGEDDELLVGISMDQYYAEAWSQWPGGQRDKFRDDVFMRLLTEGNWIPAPSVLSRTAQLRDAGLYDESLALEDLDMWLRLAKISNFAFCEQTLVTYRLVRGSLSHVLTIENNPRTKLRMYAKHLGHSAASDEWLLPHLHVWAVQHYKDGGAVSDVARVLRQVARRRPSLKVFMFASVASLGIPWSRISVLVGRGSSPAGTDHGG